MFPYYVDLGVRALSRNPLVTALIVILIAVGERRRQIGVRRALGARRMDILAYILAENFLIATGGIFIGAVLAWAVNVSLMHYLEMASLPAWYITLGSVLLLVLGQCAALSPARRASSMGRKDHFR